MGTHPSGRWQLRSQLRSGQDTASRRIGIALVLVTALITGCATQPAPQATPVPKRSVNLSGYSSEFKQGYSDGCASATPSTPRTRDEVRYKVDSNYAQGWRDGYDICGRKR